MSFDVDWKGLVGDMITWSGTWLDALDSGDILTLFVGFAMVLVAAAVVWQVVSHAPGGS